MAGITNLHLPNTCLIYEDKIIYLCIKGNNAFLLPLVVNKVSSISHLGLHRKKGQVNISAVPNSSFTGFSRG